MNQLYQQLSVRIESLRTAHPRSKRALANAATNVLIKISNIFLSFWLVRLTIDLLGAEQNGIWVAISSLVTFASFFDVGLGNGLRNRLTEVVAEDNHVLGRTYISTAYALFIGILAVLLTASGVLIYQTSWHRLTNFPLPDSYVSLLVFITLASFCLKMILDTVSYVLLSLQQTALSNVIYLTINLGSVVGIWLLSTNGVDDLLSVALVFGLMPVGVLLLFSIYYYQGSLRTYKPSWKYVDWSVRPRLMSLGFRFFMIQLAGVVIYYTDNVIISKLFGPKYVTDYSVVFRYYNAINSFFFIIISPFWSAFTEAYVKNELDWVKRSYRRLKFSWLLTLVAIASLLLLAPLIYEIWLGSAFVIDWPLHGLMGTFVLLVCWNNIAVTVLNGFGKIRLQLYTTLAGAIINLPLCLLFGRYLNFGIKGIVMASIVSLAITAILGSVQADKLVSRRAQGIWGE
ncbi:lipopolysaccharide biosynthesis protein [Fibrella sp. WM1]|uniref:lipopolysaccharide biosynthesis protein n=1 Tax=Fibrella musci TaxID=3242485 RepID=UPI0035224806